MGAPAALAAFLRVEVLRDGSAVEDAQLRPQLGVHLAQPACEDVGVSLFISSRTLRNEKSAINCSQV